jgi:FtsH-binding integral membrane protein
MPGCEYFIANTFAHLLGGLFITGISSENSVIDDIQHKPITHLATIVIVLVLLFATMNASVGPIKYGLFGLLCIVIGQTLAAAAQRLKQKGVLSNTLLTVAGIFSVMTVIGLIDNQNMLSLGIYLSAGLIALLISMVGVALFATDKEDQHTMSTWLSRALVLLFTLYIGFDIQTLKANAAACDDTPDYVNESISLYLDIINIFSGVSALED